MPTPAVDVDRAYIDRVTLLARLALSRSTLDRAADRRAEPGLLGRLLDDEATAVLVLDAEQAPVRPAGDRDDGDDGRGDGDGGEGDGPVLDLLAPQQARDRLDPAGTEPPPLAAYLGRDRRGREYVALAQPRPLAPRDQQPANALPAGVRWAGLRELGTVLGDRDAGLLTTAVALVNWHAQHGACARCGQPTEPVSAGWARHCPACGAEHYPRTDPAVIMAVTDEDDRLLLGRQARWPAKRFSTLAGFVEPGESLEAAVRREVLEEAGIVVDEVEYKGSQPWPFPSSLMLGFHARGRAGEPVVDGEELAQARWFSREDLRLDVATEEVLLPPRVSIARRLIEDWFGGPISDGGGVWR